MLLELVVLVCFLFADGTTNPNIIFMFIDDLGFNDVGWSDNTYTRTPFLDNLVKKEGLTLTNNYVEKVCTPTRAAFLTGRYPSRYGFQHSILQPTSMYALTKEESLLSREFQSQGYDTHIVGKWHLGYLSKSYTPLYRGFDSFYGFYVGEEGYFTHNDTCTVKENGNSIMFNGYDLRNGDDIVPLEDHLGTYGPYLQRDAVLSVLSSYVNSDSTANRHIKTNNNPNAPFFLYVAWQVSHTPAESLSQYYELYSENEDTDDFESKQLHHMAQITSLDDIMDEVVTYLKENNLWDNTLVVVSSDNGAAYQNGDTSPLRGTKDTVWEGAVRVPGFITGGYLPKSRRGQSLSNALVHAIDWYPTLLSAANLQITYAMEDDSTGNKPVHEIDGMNLWPNIIGKEDDKKNNTDMYNRELVLSLDSGGCRLELCGAIRVGNWKYISSDSSLVEDAAHSQTCFWVRTFEKSSDNILGCGKSPQIDDLQNACYNSSCASELGCLFDLSGDPCEYYDVSSTYPEIVEYLRSRLKYYNQSQVDPLDIVMPTAPSSVVDPSLYDDYWTPFLQSDEVTFETVLENNWKKLEIDLKTFSKDNLQKKEIVQLLNKDNKDKKNSKTENHKNNYKNTWTTVWYISAILIITAMLCYYCLYCNKKNNYEQMSEFQPLLIK